MFSFGTPACVKRSTDMAVHSPRVFGTDESLGLLGREGAALIFYSICETNEVGSLGIQLPITMRPPGLVTRTISLATSKG